MRLPGMAIGMMRRRLWLPDDDEPTVGRAASTSMGVL